MHVCDLRPGSIFPIILYRYASSASCIRIVVDRNDPAVILRGEQPGMVCPDVDALVHLLSSRIHRILPHAER